MQSFSDNILCEEDSKSRNKISMFLKENSMPSMVIISVFIFILISIIIMYCYWCKKNPQLQTIYEAVNQYPDEIENVFNIEGYLPKSPPPGSKKVK